MTKTHMIAAALLTIAYDLVAGWMVGFTLSWGGLDDFLKPSLGSAVFWIIAASPVVLTTFVVSRFWRIDAASDPRREE